VNENILNDRWKFAVFPDIPRTIQNKHIQLRKDLASTILSIYDLKSIQLSIDIQRNYELMNMRPYELDLHPELLFNHLSIRDLIRIVGGKSLQGTTLKLLSAPTTQVIERYIPSPLPQKSDEGKKSLLNRLFGSSKDGREENRIQQEVKSNVG